jgi:hypothetical protein
MSVDLNDKGKKIPKAGYFNTRIYCHGNIKKGEDLIGECKMEVPL